MDEFEIETYLEEGDIRLVVLAAPFAEVKLRITYYRNGKLVDEYRSRGVLDFQAVSNAQWFIEKYAWRGSNWYSRLLEWWGNKAWPQISNEIIRRNKPAPNPNINLRAAHRDFQD